MTDEQLYCDGPGQDGNECGRPVAGHGDGGTGTSKCEAHLKQLQRTGRMVPIAEVLTPLEKAMKAMDAVRDADSDEDYDAAVRSFAVTSKGFGAKERSEAIKKALAAARAKGVRLGRPPKPLAALTEPREQAAEVKRLVKVLGSKTLVARVLNVHRNTVRARLAAKGGAKSPSGQKSTISVHAPSAGSKRPRSGRGSS